MRRRRERNWRDGPDDVLPKAGSMIESIGVRERERESTTGAERRVHLIAPDFLGS